MGMLSELRAGDPQAATRSVVLTLALFAGVVTGLTKYQEPSVSCSAYAAGWVTVLVLIATAAVHLHVDPPRLDRWLSGTVIAVGGVVPASDLNLLTQDGKAAAHLPQVAVIVATGAAVLADCAACCSCAPWPRRLPACCSSAPSWSCRR